MLVFDLSRVRRLPVRIVHDCHALMIFFFQQFVFKSETAVGQFSKTISIVRIDRSGVDDLVPHAFQFLSLFQIICGEHHVTAFIQLPNQLVVSFFRYSLMRIIKIIVVVDVPDRNSLDDRCGQVLTVSSPLFFRIPFDEFLIYVCAHQTDGLFFQI